MADQTLYPNAPNDLSERSKSLWNAIIGRRVKSAGRTAQFLEALRALDRADEAREQIEKEELVIPSKNGGIPHQNPLLKIEQESRTLFNKIWSQLNLSWDPKVDGRVS